MEFKTTPSHIGREICAFANTAGGRILVGVDDQGNKVGVRDQNRAKSEIQTSARNLDPPLVLDIEAVGNVLVVTVPSGPDKPYSANGLFYLREAANTQQMKREEIRAFFFREGLIRFDEQPCSRFVMERDFDSRKYAAFCRSTGIPRNLKRTDVLGNLQVLTGDGMTNAGALLFSKRVPQFFLQASISCALFQGTTKTKILDQATFQGSIPENYNDAISYLMSHLNTEYVIRGGPREEILELPEVALREAVVNAIAHRDYRSTSYVQVSIFQDRVEVLNPGGLVSGLRMKDLGHVSRPRNLLLFSLMARMDLVEHIGSGIKRIREATRAHGLEPPRIEADGDCFSITFKRKSIHEAIERLRGRDKGITPSAIGGVNEGVNEGANEGINEGINEGVNGGASGGVSLLLELIQRSPGLRTPQISKAVGVPVKTLERWIKKLKEDGFIEFKGSTKSGGYRVKQ